MAEKQKTTKPSRESLINDLRTMGSKKAVAQKYNASRVTLYKWMNDYGIKEKDINTDAGNKQKENSGKKKSSDKSRYGQISPDARRATYEIKVYAEQILPPGIYETLHQKEHERVEKSFVPFEQKEKEKVAIKSFLTAPERKKAEAINLFNNTVEEQIETRVQHTLGELALAELEKRITQIDKSEIKVFVFYHDKDVAEDKTSPYSLSIVKPHFHIDVVVESKGGRVTIRLRTILNMLGITIRDGLDDGIWKHGIRPISNIGQALAYGTHETEAAQNDGKHLYTLDSANVITNDNEYLVNQRELYFATVRQHDSNVWNKKTRKQLFEQLGKEARALGKNGGDLERWCGSLPVDVYSDSKMKGVREQYWTGVDELVESLTTLKRIVVFIEGPASVGKTTAAVNALCDIGIDRRDILMIDHNGTGKMDKVIPSTKALVFDDRGYNDLFGLFDQRPAGTYRRNSKDGVFLGQYIIITYNKDFESWCKEQCGLDPAKMGERQWKALQSRVFICKMILVENYYQMTLVKKAARGTKSYSDELLHMFDEYEKLFNEREADYIPYFDDDAKVENHDDHIVYKHGRPSAKKSKAKSGKRIIGYSMKITNDFFVTYDDGTVEDLRGTHLEQLKQLKLYFPDDEWLDQQIIKQITIELNNDETSNINLDKSEIDTNSVVHHPNPDDVPF